MDYLKLIPFVVASQLEGIKDELADTVDKTQMFRTRTEMEISVLNDTKFPTAASKYWQSMREQNVHFTELVRLSYDYRRNEVKEEKLNKKLEEVHDRLDKKLLVIDLEELRFNMMLQAKAARERVREVLNWSAIKAREALQMAPDELADVDGHQLISYTKRWIKQSIIMGGGGSPPERQNLLGQLRSGILGCIKIGEFFKVIEDFPDDIQKKIIEEYRQELQIAGPQSLSI